MNSVIEPRDVRASTQIRQPDGTPILFDTKMHGAIYDDDGKPISAFMGDGDALVRTHRFRSFLPIGAVITCAWIVPADRPVPPQFILNSIAKELAAGGGVLIVSNDRAARDQAKKAILDLLASRGQA